MNTEHWNIECFEDLISNGYGFGMVGHSNSFRPDIPKPNHWKSEQYGGLDFQWCWIKMEHHWKTEGYWKTKQKTTIGIPNAFGIPAPTV